jgi:hypothetical protein
LLDEIRFKARSGLIRGQGAALQQPPDQLFLGTYPLVRVGLDLG